MRWRLGEITDTNAPNFRADESQKYEIETVWESGPITVFNADGSSYRITDAPHDQYGPSLTLGGYPYTMLEHVGGLATYADLGIYHTPEAIQTVTDAHGNVSTTGPVAPSPRAMRRPACCSSRAATDRAAESAASANRVKAPVT